MYKENTAIVLLLIWSSYCYIYDCIIVNMNAVKNDIAPPWTYIAIRKYNSIVLTVFVFLSLFLPLFTYCNQLWLYVHWSNNAKQYNTQRTKHATDRLTHN